MRNWSTLGIKGMKPKKLNTTVTQYKTTKSNICTSSPFYSIISRSLLIYINLSPPPQQFPIPKLVEIHKLPIGIWYIPSTAVLVAAKTSFLFFNFSLVESQGAAPESDEYEKIQIMHSLNQPNTGKAQIFKPTYYIIYNYRCK